MTVAGASRPGWLSGPGGGRVRPAGSSVIFRNPEKADERATATTPTISAAIPPAWIASMPG